MAIQFNAGSLKITLLAFTKIGQSEQKAAKAAVRSAGKKLRRYVNENISLTDHTLAQLAAHNPPHPYALRHGSIMIHTNASKTIATPEFRVHTQSGTMKDALRDGAGSGMLPSWKVWIDTGVAPHAEYVVGSLPSYMIPRDFMWSTADAPYVKQQMLKAITLTLGKAMRTGAALRATGV